ncbi:hypothetical protein C7974DRAFT_468559 [Boeremia exigua]|uniref:uncharacterized protein n=1 Tax=Boeremia exigua TaxID=749465 RepID=UPI001E8DCC6A|nr:uncharacterized protein C7974DRAFT_468559 [Boeremia exigua]KAH6642136.1 hypothetical protein C7974DRAFT_468559 [Boeremia exigua]
METKSDDAKEQLLALLCRGEDPWVWGGDAHNCRVRFERNGIGGLNCGENQRSWISSEFNWVLLTEPVRADTGIWTFTIEMTLTTRFSSEYHETNHWFKGAALQDYLQKPPPPSEAPFSWAPLYSAAFLPKQFTLTLSRGTFIEPFHEFVKPPYPLFQRYRFAPTRYSYKISFDKSPYPPPEEWDKSFENNVLGASMNYHRYWEMKDFVWGRKDKTWAQTLDLGWWLSPSVGDGYWRGRERHPIWDEYFAFLGKSKK